MKIGIPEKLKLKSSYETQTQSKLEYYEQRLIELSNDNENLKQRLDSVIQAQEEVTKCLEAIAECKSENYSLFLTKRFSDLKEKTITLSANDYFQFWTDIHEPDELYFSKVTSRILPCYWNSPEMQLYERRQIRNIRRFLEYNDQQKKSAYNLINESISTILKELIATYEDERIGKELMNKRLGSFIDQNFERIFIIDSRIYSENKADLVKVIERQIGGQITVKVICLNMTETSTFRRPQDFGILITTDGELFGMFCDVDCDGHPQGGLAIADKNKISHYLDCYIKIRGRSIEVPNNSTEKEIERILENAKKNTVDISDPELYGNRCLMCLKEAEDLTKNTKWENEESAIKTWYEVIRSERSAVSEVLKLRDFSSILEIGTGPGRVINIILDLYTLGDIRRPKQIVGYEQNPEIQNYATRIFKNNTEVIIYYQLVGFSRKNGKFHGIRADDRNSFDLIVAISNLVGWQDGREVEWISNIIKDGLTPQGMFFFTVYKRGFELERARMYQAAGDIIELEPEATPEKGVISICADAFGGEKHQSHAYDYDELEFILNGVHRQCKSYGINIKSNHNIDAGELMWGVLIETT